MRGSTNRLRTIAPGIALPNREKAVRGRSTGNQHMMGPQVVDDQPIVADINLFGQATCGYRRGGLYF